MCTYCHVNPEFSANLSPTNDVGSVTLTVQKHYEYCHRLYMLFDCASLQRSTTSPHRLCGLGRSSAPIEKRQYLLWRRHERVDVTEVRIQSGFAPFPRRSRNVDLSSSKLRFFRGRPCLFLAVATNFSPSRRQVLVRSQAHHHVPRLAPAESGLQPCQDALNHAHLCCYSFQLASIPTMLPAFTTRAISRSLT